MNMSTDFRDDLTIAIEVIVTSITHHHASSDITLQYLGGGHELIVRGVVREIAAKYEPVIGKRCGLFLSPFDESMDKDPGDGS